VGGKVQIREKKRPKKRRSLAREPRNKGMRNKAWMTVQKGIREQE